MKIRFRVCRVEGVEATAHIATAATRRLLEKGPIDDKGPRVLDSAQETRPTGGPVHQIICT
jgi:hypothetical protein